jgi:hypothetical protein
MIDQLMLDEGPMSQTNQKHLIVKEQAAVIAW